MCIDELPDDPARLEQQVLDLAEELAQVKRALANPDLAIARQLAELEELRRRRGVGRLPQNLPRETQLIDLEESERRCGACQVEMSRIGEDRSERLEYVSASWKIVESARPRYACPKCHQGVHSALATKSIVEGGFPGPGLLAHLVVSKYASHLPLYCLEQIDARDGVEIARSTMSGWIRDVAQALTPIVEEMNTRVLTSYVLHTDDTPVTVIDPHHKNGSRTGRLWVYLGDEGEAIFDFTMSRRRDAPLTFLQKYAGYIQAHAFSGYDALFESETRVEVACWAHARRRFVAAHEAHEPKAARAPSAIQSLYRIEAEAVERRLSFEEREALRRERAVLILAQLGAWLAQEKPHVIPSLA